MYRTSVTYTNLDGEEVTRTLYFHMSSKDWIQADAEKKELGFKDYQDYLDKTMGNSKDPDGINAVAVLTALEDVIWKAYGERPEDGERIVKSADISSKFMDSLAYDAFFDDLMTKPALVQELIASLVPKSISNQAKPPMSLPLL